MTWLLVLGVTLLVVLRLVRRRRAQSKNVLDLVRSYVPGTRGTWCRKQRHLLVARGGSVVWVRDDALPWAKWGARRGYFELQFMEGLPYLRALGAPEA